MSQFCTKCGSQNLDTGLFCQSCGARFDEAKVSAPVTVQEVAPVALKNWGAPTDGRANYKIEGHDVQFVEIELEPGESVVAEAGAMMYMEQGIQMETIFGDGSGKDKEDFGSKLLSAGKRMLTGESLFMTLFTNRGGSPQKVAYSAPYPGKIIVLNLSEFGGQIICQKDSFLCAEKGTQVEIAFQKNVGAALFGGEGFIMQKLIGNRNAFVHSGGTITRRDLRPGEMLRVDTGCLVAMTTTVTYDIQFSGIKTALFSGEGLALATLTGPGTIWLQSLPFSRVIGIIKASMGGKSGGTREEGSLIGNIGIGSLFGK